MTEHQKLSELHEVALEEFADDPEAIKRLNAAYEEIKRRYNAALEQLRAKVREKPE